MLLRRILPRRLFAGRRKWISLLVMAALAGVAWLAWRHYDAGDDNIWPIYDRRKPPVGAMELHKRKDGSVDFEAETQDGLMGLRSGSQALSDLPYGMPIYPGAQVKQSNTLSGPAVIPGKLLEFTSPDPRDKILAWYRHEVRLALLKTMTDAEIGSQWVIEAGYPDGRDGGFHLSVTKGPKGGSRVLLTTGFGENYMVEAPDPQAYIDDLLANSSNALVNRDEVN